MRHGVKGRKFGRYSSHRSAMLANLAKSLLEHEQITTTLPKAKDLRPYVEKLITLGQKGSLHHRRQAISKLGSVEIAGKIMGELATRFKDRSGGYTRIIKAGTRHGDNAPMAVIELIGNTVVADKATKARKIQDDAESSEKAAA